MYDSMNLQFFSGHVPSRECKMDSSCRITVQTCEKQKDRVRLKKFANYKNTGLVAVPDWGKKLISRNSLCSIFKCPISLEHSFVKPLILLQKN